MPRRLLALNVILLAAAIVAAASIARTLTDSASRPPAARARTAAPAAVPKPEESATTRPAPGTYTVIASRNLFSPTRSEAPPTPVAAMRQAPPMPKPNLYGVVLKEGTPVAYLEDPITKRVAGYRVGDAVAGGTVQRIDSDHVVLARPEGTIDVRLRDPAKPRPAAPIATPGQLTGPGAQQPPGAIPPQSPVVQQPGAQPESPASTSPPRRTLPPNLLRRAVPGSPSDATPQQ
jgi:hypothetical protein